MPISDTYHTEKISFRFVDFPAELLPQLSNSLPGVEVKTKEHKDERGLVVWLRLDGNGTCDALLSRSARLSSTAWFTPISDPP